MIKDINSRKTTEDQSVGEATNGACDYNAEDSEQTSTDNVADESFEIDDKTAAMSEVAQEWKDKYLRLSAEFDNFRKRTLREKMDLIAAGGEDVIKPMLGVMDDFDRAVAAMEKATDVIAVKEGVVLIRQKFADTLRSKGVSEIEAVGAELDTDLHDAVAQIPAPEAKLKGRIVDVVQKGYRLKDKVIRHSKVVVGE